MRRVAWIWLVAAGCGFQHGATPATGPDGALDGPSHVTDACTTFSTQLDTCSAMLGSDALVLSGSNKYDTDTNTLTQPSGASNPAHVMVNVPGGRPIDLLLVGSVSLASGAKLRVTGAAAFGIIATGAVQIDGAIDLTANGGGARTDALCGTSIGAKGAALGGGAGGGGGGGFQGAGGKGGPGNKDGPNTEGGAGGAAIARPTVLLGGCDGGAGGNGSGTGGANGNGGGAIVIASAASITVSASGGINVGGGLGHAGGNNGDGGSGGGSGGMILLESRMVTIAGILASNGGSGGEGNTNGNDGLTGAASANAVAGGSGGDGNGGDGAAGGALAGSNGADATDLQNGGGGGGGGGVGYIAIACPAPVITGTISPAFAAWP